MRKPKTRCSGCEKWQPKDSWKSTFNPNFAVFAWGTCMATGKVKANCEHSCRFFVAALRGKIFVHKL